MAIPTYGSKGWSWTFLALRVLECIFLAAILGIMGNFVATMTSQHHDPSFEIGLSLGVTALITLYTLFFSIGSWAFGAETGLMIMAIVDFLIVSAFISFTVVFGQPVAALDCSLPGGSADKSVIINIMANLNKPGSKLTLQNWSGLDKKNCNQTKDVLGFAIFLAILFCSSSFTLAVLVKKNKKYGPGRPGAKGLV